jgi:hypothetical protein
LTESTGSFRNISVRPKWGKARYILTFALWLGLGGVAYGQGGQLMTFPSSPITITLPYDPVGQKWPPLKGTDPKINFDIKNIASPIAQVGVKVAPGSGANNGGYNWATWSPQGGPVSLLHNGGFSAGSADKLRLVQDYKNSQNTGIGVTDPGAIPTQLKFTITLTTAAPGSRTETVTLDVTITRGPAPPPPPGGNTNQLTCMNLPVNRRFIRKGRDPSSQPVPEPQQKKPPSGPYKLRIALRQHKRLPTSAKPRPK